MRFPSEERLPRPASLHTQRPTICTGMHAVRRLQQSGQAQAAQLKILYIFALKRQHTRISTFFFFFIDSSRENSSFLLLHILLRRFFGAFRANPKETGVGPGHAQAGKGLEVLLVFRDNAGLLPFENLVGERAPDSQPAHHRLPEKTVLKA